MIIVSPLRGLLHSLITFYKHIIPSGFNAIIKICYKNITLWVQYNHQSLSINILPLLGSMQSSTSINISPLQGSMQSSTSINISPLLGSMQLSISINISALQGLMRSPILSINILPFGVRLMNSNSASKALNSM
jgi:hypothetical protein